MNHKKMIIEISVIVFVIAMIATSGCISGTGSEGAKTIDSTESCDIRDYGNGVLFFGCDDATFGQSLSQYLDTHGVMVTAIAEVDQQFVEFQNTIGYFVIVRK